MHIYIDFHNHTGRHIYVYIITDLLSSNIWFRLLCNKSSFDSAYTKGKFYLTPSIGDKHDDIKQILPIKNLFLCHHRQKCLVSDVVSLGCIDIRKKKHLHTINERICS